MAHPKGIREFTGTYPGAQQLFLEECMRCGPEVVHVATWLIEQELTRIPKSLRSETKWDSQIQLIVANDEAEEVGAITSLIQRSIDSGVEESEILVLLPSDKNGHMSSDLVSSLQRNGIESYLPRASLASTDEAQQFVEYMKLAQSLRTGNVDDLALRSLLELEKNGIGKKRLLAVVRKALDDELRFAEALERLRSNPEEFSSSGLTKLLKVAELVLAKAKAVVQREGEAFLDWVDRVLEMLAPGDGVAADVRHAAYAANEVLRDMVDAASVADLNFVSELSASLAEIEDARPPRVDGKVTITTMHGSKGLSADVVFVLHAEDEIMPNGKKANDLDESRRLLYVSLTRARKELNIHVCSYRRKREFANKVAVSSGRTLTRFLEDYGLEGIGAWSL